MKNFLFVGEKNSGKSTVLYNLLKRAEFSCGGIISLPVFSGGKKIGADVIDIQTDERRILTRVKKYAHFSGETVGRYVISGEGIEHGKRAIKKAIDTCDCIVIDEIGPLELGGKGWIKEAEQAFERGNVTAVVRKSLQEKFLETYGENFIIMEKDSLSKMLREYDETRKI